MAYSTIVVHTRNRVAPLRKTLERLLAQDDTDFEILIYDDGSDLLNLREVLQPEFPDPRITWLRGETPLGLVPARDYALRQAKGDIVIGMDDDAYFIRKDTVRLIAEHFRTHSDHAALAVKIIEKEHGQQRLLVPFTRLARQLDPDIVEEEQFVSYYVGPCYAVRRMALQRVGYFSLKTSYGEDEVDLSYRLIRAGLQIFYRPDFVVIHDPERQRDKRAAPVHLHMQNRIYLAYQYLPFPYAFTYVVAWLVFYSVACFRHHTTGFPALVRGIVTALTTMRKEYKRQPLGKAALDYAAAHHGRLWY